MSVEGSMQSHYVRNMGPLLLNVNVLVDLYTASNVSLAFVQLRVTGITASIDSFCCFIEV